MEEDVFGGREGRTTNKPRSQTQHRQVGSGGKRRGKAHKATGVNKCLSVAKGTKF